MEVASKGFESHWCAGCSEKEILLRFPALLRDGCTERDFIRK